MEEVRDVEMCRDNTMRDGRSMEEVRDVEMCRDNAMRDGRSIVKNR
jgi:exosome complex RNA-binding protein Rrp42 (RNase PH superfamily)